MYRNVMKITNGIPIVVHRVDECCLDPNYKRAKCILNLSVTTMSKSFLGEGGNTITTHIMS